MRTVHGMTQTIRRPSRRGILVASLVCLLCSSLGLAARLRDDAGASLTAAPPAPTTPSTAPVVAECTGGDALDFDCWEARYVSMVGSAGADAALADLDAARRTSGFVFAACHQLTHRIGRVAGERLGRAAFGEGSTLCASGYYHGVSEAVMAAIGPANVERDAMSVCAEQRATQPGSNVHYNCVHGMGHGFMGVFESDMFRSLDACETLGDPWEQEQCYGGVFMENMSALNHATRPTAKNLRVDEPLYPCTAVARQFKAPCYEKQTAYALFISDDDFGHVFELCATTPEHELRLVCDEGIGGDAAIHASKYLKVEADQLRSIRTLCGLGADDEARAHCLAGAVRTAIRDRGEDDAHSAAICAASDVAAIRELCERTRAQARAELLARPAETTHATDATDATGHHH